MDWLYRKHVAPALGSLQYRPVRTAQFSIGHHCWQFPRGFPGKYRAANLFGTARDRYRKIGQRHGGGTARKQTLRDGSPKALRHSAAGVCHALTV